MYGPLLQFEFYNFFGFSCVFDVAQWLAYAFSCSNELIAWSNYIFLFLGSWTWTEFYFGIIIAIIFDFELALIDLLTQINYNYTILLSLFFSIILFFNISGLIPYVPTLTAQIGITLFLSFIILYILWTQAFFLLKLKIANHFLPPGSPLIIIPFIINIELISTSSRIISLAVRLFANITSGHALLKILSGFALISLSNIVLWKILFITPVIVIFSITGLECLIAFLQSYVFLTLVIIYIAEQE